MTLRKKVFLAIALALVSLITTIYAASSSILLKGFIQVEEQSMAANLARVTNALSDNLAAIDSTTHDYSSWDDTYAFVADGDPDYIAGNLITQTFDNLSMNVMVFVGPAGQVVYGQEYDLQTKTTASLPANLLAQVAVGNLLVQHSTLTDSVSGLILVDESLFLVVSRPILTSRSLGPSHGTLLMGRYLNGPFIEQLAQKTQLPLIFRRYAEPELPLDFQTARAALTGRTSTFVQALTEESIAGYALLMDIYGRPAALLRVDLPRTIYQQGQTALHYFLVVLIIFSLVFGAATFALADRLMRTWQHRKESEERYRSVAETAHDAIVSIDQAGKIVSWNNGAQAMFQYSAGDVLNQPAILLAAPGVDLPALQARLALSPTLNSYEAPGRRKDGSEFSAEISLAFWQTAQGRFYTAIIRDITDRKRMECALRQAHADLEQRVQERTAQLEAANIALVTEIVERRRAQEELTRHRERLEELVRERTHSVEQERQRTQAILDGAGESIVFLDTLGRIEYMNRAAEQLTGYTLAEIRGQLIQLFIGEAGGPGLAEASTSLRKGEVWQGQGPVRHKTGPQCEAAVTFAPLYADAGRTQQLGFTGIMRDISRQKQLERIKDEFVTNVSHELRTPLANVHLYLNLLETGKPEKREQYIQTLQRERARLDKLVEDLLAVSQLDLDAVPVTLIPTPINQVLSHLVVDRSALLAEHGLQLACQLAADLPLALADFAMVSQVLSNLVTNATHYTPRGGVVTLLSEMRQQAGQAWVTFTVQDTGPGLSPAERPHLFERFFRGEAARRSAVPGTGLGLAICQEIVDKMKGHITVESEPGHGAAFTVWLSPTDEPLCPAKVYGSRLSVV